MPSCDFDHPSCRQYLQGTMFDENLTIRYNFARPIHHRSDILAGICIGKSVLHVGCCDHISLIGAKIANDTWLHGILSRVASDCIGVDIDVDAVAQARGLSQQDNIICGDVTAQPRLAEIENRRFDYAIFGEVIEHIGNPVLFLSSFLQNYGSCVSNLVITVPNSFRAGAFKSALRHSEILNSDHRFSFTPYTIAKVAWDAGIEPVSVTTAIFSPASKLKRTILNAFPLLAEDIIYIGTPRRR
jgi:hypothetical protein